MAHFEYPVTTGAGGSGTLIISTDEYCCDETELYKTEPKMYWRYKAHSYYGWYMVSQCDAVNRTAGMSAWGYRVAYSVDKMLTNMRIRGRSDPSSLGTGFFTQNKEGQSQAGYDSATLTTYNDCQEVPNNVLGWGDHRVDRMDECIVSMNAPIFRTDTEVVTYIQYGTGIENAINFRPNYPEAVGEKWTSTKLNLLRRRLMRLAVSEMDYSPYFNYTIADGKAWVTSVKRDRWQQDFGNLNIIIPNSIEGYPVVVVNSVWDW